MSFVLSMRASYYDMTHSFMGWFLTLCLTDTTDGMVKRSASYKQSIEGHTQSPTNVTVSRKSSHGASSSQSPLGENPRHTKIQWGDKPRQVTSLSNRERQAHMRNVRNIEANTQDDSKFTHRQLHKVFRAFDSNNDRTLTKHEFYKLLHAIGAFVSQ